MIWIVQQRFLRRSDLARVSIFLFGPEITAERDSSRIAGLMLDIARLATAHVEAEADRVMPSRAGQGRAETSLTSGRWARVRFVATRRGAATRGAAIKPSGCAAAGDAIAAARPFSSGLNAKAPSFSAWTRLARRQSGKLPWLVEKRISPDRVSQRYWIRRL